MLGIIIVNYKSNRETIDYIEKEICKVSTPHKIAIVNNAGSYESNAHLSINLDAEILKPEDTPKIREKRIFVLKEEENIGYARGNNLGAKFLLNNFPIRWLLITNNDIVIEDADVVEAMIQRIETMPDVGMIGPKIIAKDGSDQSPYRYTTIWSQIILQRLLYPIVYFCLKAGYLSEVIEHAKEGRYYRVMGSFCLFKKEAFEMAGGFDETTFLYAEEAIISERLKAVGFSVYYLPIVKVIHNHGQTISANCSKKFVFDTTFRSLLHYYSTYRGTPHWVIKLAKLSNWIYYKIYDPVLRIVRPLIRW
jgi:GT2 family glycosyltransferase